MHVVEYVDAESGEVIATMLVPDGNPRSRPPRKSYEAATPGSKNSASMCIHIEREPSFIEGSDVVYSRNPDGSLRWNDEADQPFMELIPSGVPCTICTPPPHPCIHSERGPSIFPGWDVVYLRDAQGNIRRDPDNGRPYMTTIRAGEPCPICTKETIDAA